MNSVVTPLDRLQMLTDSQDFKNLFYASSNGIITQKMSKEFLSLASFLTHETGKVGKPHMKKVGFSQEELQTPQSELVIEGKPS